jgi:hypothetical protein
MLLDIIMFLNMMDVLLTPHGVKNGLAPTVVATSPI